MAPKKSYENRNQNKLSISLKDILRWYKERYHKRKDLSFVVPQSENFPELLHANHVETSITWIGHATFLIQLGGLNILTDPVWARYMGVAKRLTAPGLALTQLPQIDVVLISHNHYDHLDFKSLQKLKGNPLHLVPEGLGKLFRRKGLQNVEEFVWWQYKQLGQVNFTFVPAQHWSKRTPWDTNQSLWGGWIMGKKSITPGSENNSIDNIYFVGDSGYFSGFKTIGQRLQISHVLMPIGAYEPEWFMHVQHVTPEQAVQAYLDLGADYFIPMHYDAFRLGDDTPEEALQRLDAAWTNKRIDSSRLHKLKLGETLWTER